MKDLMGLMKQAKDMQKKMESAQEMVADLTAIGRSGGGLVVGIERRLTLQNWRWMRA